MPPVEGSFTVSGKIGKEIKVEDGVTVVLDTPVGQARGKVKPPNKSLLYGSLASRFEVAFPGVGEMHMGILKEENPNLIIRESTYQTQEGEVVVVFKATNPSSSKK